jgi:hypothetical protein
MSGDIPRREFLKSVPITAYALTSAVGGSVSAQTPARRGAAARLDAFDYEGVTLGPSRW